MIGKSFYIKVLSIILISILGVAVYSNTFYCAFHFDDHSSIVDNLAIKNPIDLQTIWNYLPRRFILYLSLAINYHFNQLNVFGYHLFNLAVHITTAVLVWWFVLLTLSTPAIKKSKISQHANAIPLLAALVFVSHPLQTQAVTYIVQRAASMAAMFYVASLCFYIKSRLLESKGRFYYAAALITVILAMFTKETAITLPLMILFYEFCFFKDEKSFKWGHAIPFLVMVLTIPLIMLLTETSAVRLQVLRNEPGISSVHYLLTQIRVVATYIRLLFIPLNQNLDYDYPVSNSLFELPLLISLLFSGVILLFARRLFSKYRLISFSIFWFYLTLLPESSFLPIRDVIYEHRLYLPMVGFSLFMSSGIYYVFDFYYRHSQRSEESKGNLRALASLRMTIALFTLIIGCYSVLTYQRNKVWKSELSLWDDTVRKSPHKARPYNNRANAYFDQGDFTKALLDVNRALDLDPNYGDAHYTRGNVYIKQNNFMGAIADYSRAIEINPADAEAYNNRGNAYNKEGNLSKAISDYTKALILNPHYADPYYNRACIYAKEGDYTKAIADFTSLIGLNPNDAGAYNGRGSVYEKQGNTTQAMSDFNTAIEINSMDALSYNNRGSLFANRGEFTQALFDFNKTIEIDANNAEAYYNRGLLYDKQGNYIQAITDYGKAIEINPQYEKAYYNRGSIYDKQNSFAEAISDYTNAIELNPQNAQAYNNRGIIYAKENNFIVAISDFNKAIEINPRNAEAYNNRGLTFAKQGDVSRAIADYNQAIEIKNNYAQAYYNRGIIDTKLNNITQSISDYSKAVEINPNYAAAYYNRSVNYYQLKEFDKSWVDVRRIEGLGMTINPDYIKALKQASGVG